MPGAVSVATADSQGLLDCAGELAHRAEESVGFPVHPRSARRALQRAWRPKADERAEATGQDIYQGRERTKVRVNAHHGDTILVGKPPPGVDSVLRLILRPARIATGMARL